MAGELLTIELKGFAERAAHFQAAALRARDLTPVWDYAHDIWLHEIAQQFMSEGSYFLGSGWAELSPAYAIAKERHARPPAPFGILYRTGHLFEALSNEGADEHVFVSTPEMVLLGARGEAGRIGSYHQTGTATMPARPIIRMRNRFKQLLFRAAVRWITGGELPGRSEAEAA